MAPQPIVIDHRGYHPSRLEVQQGDSVWWLNEDGLSVHSATADDGSFNTGEIERLGAQRLVITHAPGSVAYHDEHGGGFTGILEVS
jgi:plastocyanin